MQLAAAESEARLSAEKLARIEHELAQLKRLVFGVKSERFEGAAAAGQASLFGGDVPAANVAPHASETVTRKVPARKPVRQALPSHLPREVVVIEPEEDTAGLRKIGEEVTETLDYRPAKLVVMRRVRPKYVDPKAEERGVVIADLPPRPLEKGMAEAALLAHVAIEKYADHLPIYRQVQRFKRQGITIAESTLGGWIATTADLLTPLYEALKGEVVASGYIQADETPIPVQDQNKKGTTHRGYYWVYHAPAPGLVVMDYQQGRSRAGPAAWLDGYKGALQSDGYRAYEHFDGLPGITGYGGWIATTADLLTPLYEALKGEVVASGYIQADETPIPVQDQNKKGTTHRGYYWVYHAPAPGLVVMDYQQGRSRAGPAAWLDGYKGALQSDGYRAYEHFDGLPGITGYGCWAHARRYFFEAKDNDAARAEYALREIKKLYAIERELAGSEPEARREARHERAVPVLDVFRVWLEANRGLPKSPWGKAVNYALARWEKLTRYTKDGHIEIDNNLVENAIRPIALGRKNYLFAGSHDAARRAAVIYSLLATCKKHDVNPQTWLADALARIPTHPHKQVADLLPHHWKQRKG